MKTVKVPVSKRQKRMFWRGNEGQFVKNNALVIVAGLTLAVVMYIIAVAFLSLGIQLGA